MLTCRNARDYGRLPLTGRYEIVEPGGRGPGRSAGVVQRCRIGGRGFSRRFRIVVPVSNDHVRPSPLRGLWSFTVGGLFLGGLLLVLDPATELAECPQYIAGGNGDFSAFRDPSWDFYLPGLAFVWITATVVEQVLGFARGSRVDTTVRATAAICLSIVVSCCGIVPLLFTCRT